MYSLFQSLSPCLLLDITLGNGMTESFGEFFDPRRQ